MISLKALQDTIKYIKNNYKYIKNERFLMEYHEYYELKAKHIHYHIKDEDKNELFKLFGMITPSLNIPEGKIKITGIDYFYITISILSEENRIIESIIK